MSKHRQRRNTIESKGNYCSINKFPKTSNVSYKYTWGVQTIPQSDHEMHFLSTLLTLCAAIPFSFAHRVGHNKYLQVDVFHLPEKDIVYQNASLRYSPSAFTLVHTAKEAVLVDAPTVAEDGAHLADWIATTIPGKKLKYIYITHAHADHFNAFPQIQQKFPEAQVVTTQKVLQHMPAQYGYPLWDIFWVGLFPSLKKADLSLVHALPPSVKFTIKSAKGKKHEFRAIEVGEGDTEDSTVLHVPDIDLIVGGDVVYGHCYQYLAENPTLDLRKQWIASLDKIKSLKPKVVVPSHMQASEGYGAEHLEQTQAYIEGWESLLAKAKSWEELESLAKKRWPDRIGSYILRYTAQTFFNATFGE
ncbi:Metallo-hydrolase/oxidoreductase [Bimuria novae-zelandiae CBS 107.79]|uniref:Metallo-hydrolase/oxidoreductase n=1 Tax=Bimuria novae-zelandiae CBS 107.79 TaxID=1447943 RepID=A0A6A5UKU1_9PLEO|nr:Metallo-hydrolase/oxidoreductase [Bimuria novae-zelandiae CBS 107.79]